jgi:hypothetical protein
MNPEEIVIPVRKRNRYFNGRLLSAQDFEDEQNYSLNRMRLHNRMLHGWGVVSGLEVCRGEDDSSVQVSPGLAIDPLGNEILLAEPISFPWPADGETACLVLCYAERLTDPLPAVGPEGEAMEFSRIEEVATLKYEAQPDGNPNGVPLARLKRGRRRWKIDKKFRLHRLRKRRSTER